MDSPSTINAFITMRHFPPVVHARHARALLAAHNEEDLRQWVGGYAVTVPEHRQLLEEILGSLAWKPHGLALLVHGLYGAGKSHLLVLLHLLSALPLSWPAFLHTHPLFGRYATAMQAHRRLVVHFSLEEYQQRAALEATVRQEVARALAAAGIPLPACWGNTLSRLDEWTALFDACRDAGYDGLLLLIDELSLFLAAKTPTQREADAGFLQFLAEMTARAPLWLIGALQRRLSDVGALRTHSWRQVEDRFRTHELPVQEIGAILRERLLERRDPPAIRALILTMLAPRAEACAVDISSGVLQLCWPFHPAAIELLAEVTMHYLSPHRSLVEVLLQVEETGLLDRRADTLLTPLDLLNLVEEDLRRDDRLEPLWHAVTLLERGAAHAANPTMARAALRLLLLLHLAERPASVAQLRTLLFDGARVPDITEFSRALHDLRRRAAYLHVLRQQEASQEVFTLALADDEGAQALARMEEVCQSYTAGDPRVIETALRACSEPSWPFAHYFDGATAEIPWCGSEHPVHLALIPTLPPELPMRTLESLLAAQADGAVLLRWPTQPAEDTIWQQATAEMSGPYAGCLLFWEPRALTAHDEDILREFAAWEHAAELTDSGNAGSERRIQQRCRERAAELQPAVIAGLHAAYLGGRWYRADGQQGTPPAGNTLVETLGLLFTGGFAQLFPFYAGLAASGSPSRAALQQLLAHFIEPGEAALPPQSLLTEYIERYALPLGCAELLPAHRARVTPPCREILDVLLAGTAGMPLRLADALTLLRRPPLGVTPLQGYLAIAAALRCGVLQGLDAFLQPLASDGIRYGQHEEAAFLAPPPRVAERYAPLIAALAARWGLSDTEGALACSQLDQRLRVWCAHFAADLPQLRVALAEWSEQLAVLPWGWQTTENALSCAERLIAETDPTLDARLAHFGEEGEALLARLEQIRDAATCWQQLAPTLHCLLHATLPAELRPRVTAIAQQLASGEACFADLASLQLKITDAAAVFGDAYRHWHDDQFGAMAIAALRDVFDSAAFRAMKWLARTPLPTPSAARRCLDGLAQARAGYCPGDLTQLTMQGHCARCRLPLDSPTPLPNAADLTAWADEALGEYAALLTDHPWAAQQQARLPRAPLAIAAQATMLFHWKTKDGAPALQAALDEPLLGWLCRQPYVAGTRQVHQLSTQLRGRDLTRREAGEIMQSWLDPDQTLGEDGVLAFE